MRDGRRHIGQASVWRMPSGPECSQLEVRGEVVLVTPGGYGTLSLIIMYWNSQTLLLYGILYMYYNSPVVLMSTFSVASNFLMAMSRVQNVPENVGM